VDHRLPEILGAGISPAMPQSDVVSRTVILDHDWMIDGKVGRSLLKIRDRVPTHVHQVRHKLVRAVTAALGSSTNCAWTSRQALAKRSRSAAAEPELGSLAHASHAFRESALPSVDRRFPLRSIIFGTKAPSDFAAPLSLEVPKPDADQNNDNRHYNDCGCRVHRLVTSG